MTVAVRGWRLIFAEVFTFGIAYGLTNVISYLYLVIAGRTLTGREFGVFNALLGLLALSGFFATSLQLAVTQAAAGNPGRAALAAIMHRTVRIALPCIALITLVAMPFGSAIGASAMQAALCGATVLAMVLGCVALGFLAGIGRIRRQAGINFLGAIARLGTGWPLVLAGIGVTGAITGYLFNYVVVLVLAWWMGRQLAADRATDHTSGVPRLRLEVSTLATFVLAFAPLSLDQFLVQVFAPSLGGDYAAVTTIAKLAFFAAYPVIAVAYPHLLRRPDARSRARLLVAAAGGVICVAVGLAWSLFAFQEQSTQIFFGDRFPEAIPHVGSLAFAVACFSLSALAAQALIAWGSRMGFLPSLVTLAAGVILVSVRHDSLATIVENQMWIYGLQLLLMSALLGVTIRRSLAAERLASSSRALSY